MLVPRVSLLQAQAQVLSSACMGAGKRSGGSVNEACGDMGSLSDTDYDLCLK